MHTLRVRLINLSAKYHGQLHFLCGLLAVAICYQFFGVSTVGTHPGAFIIIATLGSYLPDIDHLLYIYGYGRKSKYAEEAKRVLNKLDLKGFIRVVRDYHKYVTGIYSHNIGSLLLVAYITHSKFSSKEEPLLAVFFLAWSLHYIYDMIEDLLILKKLNRNWFFRFSHTLQNEVI